MVFMKIKQVLYVEQDVTADWWLKPGSAVWGQCTYIQVLLPLTTSESAEHKQTIYHLWTQISSL